MDFQELESESLKHAPPVLPWVKFAEWIGLGDEPKVLRGWVDRGYVPTLRIGKRQMTNVDYRSWFNSGINITA